MKRTLLDDVKKIYFSIPCTDCRLCRECKNYKLCKSIKYVLKSLKKYYCIKDFNSCSICDNKEKCEINQKIY